MTDPKSHRQTYKAADAAKLLEEQADEKRAKHLRERGWTYTSTTPGCYWMWLKDWRGKQWSYFKASDAMRAEAWMAEMGDEVAEGAHV